MNLISKVSYYPGCSLHGTALEYDESTKAVVRLLGVELWELPDWNCCGASSAHAIDEGLAHGLAERNLALAATQGLDLVVPCAACYSRLKSAQNRDDADGSARRNSPFQILNLVDFFFVSGLAEAIPALIKRLLTPLKVVCYYGCLLVRPPKTVRADHHENPAAMDRLMELTGAKTLPWSYKTDCCGASLALTRADIVLDLVDKLLNEADKAGAEAIVVACPLCQSNLDSRQEQIFQRTGKRHNMPVLYFTELLGLSLDHRDAHRWFKRHFVDPTGLLRSKGLM